MKRLAIVLAPLLLTGCMGLGEVTAALSTFNATLGPVIEQFATMKQEALKTRDLLKQLEVAVKDMVAVKPDDPDSPADDNNGLAVGGGLALALAALAAARKKGLV